MRRFITDNFPLVLIAVYFLSALAMMVGMAL